MVKGRFDECCPHCKHKIKNLYDCFVSSDYKTSFSFECPICNETIAVEVHSVPEFELFDPQILSEFEKKCCGITK